MLVVSFSDLSRDPRVRRQIDALRGEFGVVAAGLHDPAIVGVRFVRCARAPRTFFAKASEAATLLLGRYEAHYWGQHHVQQLLGVGEDLRADLVIANDIEALPLCLKLARGAKVILDAHEYSPGELDDRLAWRLVRQRYTEYLCDTYMPRAAGMMTVAEGIARRYRERFGVAPEVVHNAAPYHDLVPSDISPHALRMIHHGAAVPGRRIELMLEVMRGLDDRFSLDLVLLPTDPAYLERLKRHAAADRRIRFLPPVPMASLVEFGNAYDIGLYLLPPSNFNNLHALPNKLFEFIQSRLMVAVGPSPEMAALVHQYECGVVSEDFTPASLARALNALDARAVAQFKKSAHEAARALSFEHASAKLLSLVARTLRMR